MKIEIESNFPAVQRAFQELGRRGTDLTPAMRELSELLRDESEQAFAYERSPNTGAAWAPLSQTTIERRAKKGHWPGQILRLSGELASTISESYGTDFAAVGTDKDYATTMFFGAERGQFGSTSKGAPIPWGDIPGREFMGLSKEREGDVLDILGDYLLDLPST